jgi:hypothetical protein
MVLILAFNLTVLAFFARPLVEARFMVLQVSPSAEPSSTNHSNCISPAV